MKVTPIKDIPKVQVKMEGAEGVEMRVLMGAFNGAPSFTTRLFEIEPGGHTPRHDHPHEHEIIVRAGSGALWTADGELPLSTDDVVLVPPGERHQFIAGPRGMQIICIVPNEGH